MKDYSEMSDEDINKLVAGHISFADKLMVGTGQKDYCNNPADAWPIIKKAEISILKDNGLHLWCATSSAYWADGAEWQIGGDVMDANPLRAAMIVFLIMKDRESSHA